MATVASSKRRHRVELVIGRVRLVVVKPRIPGIRSIGASSGARQALSKPLGDRGAQAQTAGLAV